ncbi:helix-turn-helix transcriptional regulator [Aeribacillus pallidus]|uniref:helix-turn-helix transcriptional regulator n=1 Tax=Aeribacillus pallidus TaxID=33936 RepID=UPI003D1F3C8B
MDFHLKNRSDIAAFVQQEILTSTEAIQILGITRQRLSQLVKKGQLVPLKKEGGVSLFLRSEVEEKKMELEGLRKIFGPDKN